MKQYEQAIEILQEAMDKLKGTHIFSSELENLEYSLRVDIMYLKSCERKKLEEDKLLGIEK